MTWESTDPPSNKPTGYGALPANKHLSNSKVGGIMLRKLVVFWFISFLLYGCAFIQSFKEVISPDKEAIRALVMKYQDAWNKHDPDAYMALFHSEAKIMTGAERRFISKIEYYSLLPQRFSRSPTLKMEGDPEIKIGRDTAEVTFVASLPPTETNGIPYTLYLVRESGQWLIMKQEY